MENKFFCVLPWTEIFVNKNNASPCCVYKPKSNIKFNNYLVNKEIIELKQEFLEGKVPIQCSKCYENESSLGYSTRIASNFNQEKNKEKILKGEWKNNYVENINLLTSNICNLKCLPCEHASYSRDLELKDLGLKPNPTKFVIKEENYKTLLDYEFDKITLIGGEPFYDKKTIEIIDFLIENNKSKNTMLLINSNFTHITDDILLKLNKNFDKVILKASIDGIGKRNDYLRFPSNWTTVENNIRKTKKYSNIELIVTTALSNLSLIGYHEIVKWALQENIHYLYASIVNTPTELNPQRLPKEIKKSLIPDLKNLLEMDYGEEYKKWNRENSIRNCIKSCLQICENDKELSMKRTINWINKHDKHRKNSLLDVFPELKPYWE